MSERFLSPFEQNFFKKEDMIQFGMKICNRSYIAIMAKNITESSPAFWLKSDGKKIFHTREKPLFVELPSFVHTAKEACEYLHMNHRIDPTIRLGLVAANDEVLAFIGHHAVLDGGHAVNILNNSIVGRKDRIPILPETVDGIVGTYLPKCGTSSTKSDLENAAILYSKGKNQEANDKRWCKYISTTINSKNLQCYDKKNKSLNNFNSYLYSAMAISCAVNNEMFGRFGIGTSVDLRQCLPTDYGANLCGNLCVNPIVIPDNFSPMQSLYDLAKQYKQKLNFIKKPENIVKCITSSVFVESQSQFNGLLCNASCIGNIKFRYPITDVWIQQTKRSVKPPLSIDLTSFLKDVQGEQQVSLRIQYQPIEISDKKAHKFNAGINYILTDIPIGVSLQDTFDAVKNYVSKL